MNRKEIIKQTQGCRKDSKLTSSRCKFCHEFLIEGIDDIDNLVCKICKKKRGQMKKKCVAGLEIMKCPFWKEKASKELKVWRKKYGGIIKNEERKGVKFVKPEEEEKK